MPDTPRTDELFDACGDSGCGREQTIGAAVGLARQLERDLTAARAEVVRLREALREYGEHTGMCEWWEYGADDRHCTCGYAALCGSKAKVTP